MISRYYYFFVINFNVPYNVKLFLFHLSISKYKIEDNMRFNLHKLKKFFCESNSRIYNN